MNNILTEEEKKTYNNKLSNEFSYFNLDNKDISYKESNTLEKRIAFYNYFNKKIDFLIKEVEFNEKIILTIKNKLILRFGKEQLSDIEISELNSSILFSSKEDNEINTVEFTLNKLSSCFFKDADTYNKLIISEKDFYLKSIETIFNSEELILKYKSNIEFLVKEKTQFIPIEIKNDFYLFNNLSDYLLLSDPFDGLFNFGEKNINVKNINVFNSIFMGSTYDKKINKNPVANIIPDEKLFTNEEKLFIAKNGTGGLFGGYLFKEIYASCKEEALLKLNNWAKENKEPDWGIFNMTQPCSAGLISIIEKTEFIK